MADTNLEDGPHRDNFNENSSEVRRLLQIHGDISGDGPGYKHNVEVLNKSAIVLLVATWESYIEELAENCFEFIIQSCQTPESIPNKVLSLSTKNIRSSQNELDVWRLAEKGWLDVLKEHKATAIKKYVKSLNTPKADNIDDLFESLIGLKNITSNWYWAGMSNSKAKDKLGELISVRGEIAHTVRTSKPVQKNTVKNYGDFLSRLATISHNRCNEHLSNTLGKSHGRHIGTRKLNESNKSSLSDKLLAALAICRSYRRYVRLSSATC